nr:LCP family protein [Geodermatophilus normandii]
MLGGDGGEGREGVRTDTVIVASIATETGETTLISLPRNLEDLPFPADSPLAAIYPEGFESGSESESLLNSVYRNGPADHPDVLGPTDDPGADFLKLGVGEALGLDIDYFVLVNLDGFSRLVDALGGITVNVNYYVPINGITGQELPDDYIAPGPNQHMDGYTALQFARGRYGLTDYDRMDRQRCTIKAIIDEADPITLLDQYQELAATTQDIVSTDIPRSALDDFVDLAFLVKDADIRSVVFDTSLIDPAYPDYDLMRQIVQDAFVGSAGPAAPAPAPGTNASGAEVPNGSPPVPVEGADPAADVRDACAYDPAQAQAALDQGKPPTRNG